VTTTPAPIPPDSPEGRSALDWLDRAERQAQRALAELGAAGLDVQTEEEDLGELASASQHPADVASETLEREVELGLMADFRRAIDEIAAARERLAAGHYGICERCRAHVDPVRLEAVPAARFCRSCVDEIEHFGGLRIGGRSRSAVLVSDEFLADDDLLVDEHDDRCAEERAVNLEAIIV
jgi:RNA polymerase-binding transcription factor DksA